MSRQITIRGLGDDLELRLKAEARKHQTSLNRAAIMLMRKGAGLGLKHADADAVGDALDAFIGSWTREEEGAFLASIGDMDHVDEDFWK